jgi:hypothetical protein
VANALFRDRSDLVLLAIDTLRVMSPIKYEGTTTEIYPHIYGPINVDAIIAVYSLLPDERGRFHLPEGIITYMEQQPTAEREMGRPSTLRGDSHVWVHHPA